MCRFVKEQTRLDTPIQAGKNLPSRSTRQMFLEKEQYADDPVLNGEHDNPAILYVWRLLNDYAMAPSGGGGMSMPYVTQQDITHYQKNMGVTIDPLFIRAVMMASRVRTHARAEHESELKPNG